MEISTLMGQSPSTTASPYDIKFRAALKIIFTPGMVAHTCNHSQERELDGEERQFKSSMFSTVLPPRSEGNAGHLHILLQGLLGSTQPSLPTKFALLSVGSFDLQEACLWSH